MYTKLITLAEYLELRAKPVVEADYSEEYINSMIPVWTETYNRLGGRTVVQLISEGEGEV